MPHIDYYFATLSPFTYLSGTRPAEIAAKNGATITYKPLDIMALFARTGGTPPKDRHPNRQEYRLQELRRRALRADMPLKPKPAFWPTNGAPSAYAIITAQNEGTGDVGKLVQNFGAACWAEDRDIAQDDVIRDVLEQSGFSPDIADKGLMTSADTFARNLEDAVAAGAFGAPFFITDTDERFWGQDRLDDLDAYLAGDL
ncbi:2-hydroxychromene-2-carboxylate isomerase [Loktanella agnita]|uniref:2-hydroxychromene-2-carboxylate isomerase n=1 Tax=Loktanella agnita TaxID=287097 RepID=UPI0039859964